MNEIFLDTETTGLSVDNGHRILEIACIETIELVPTKKIFHVLIDPERKISEDATKIHGYTDSTFVGKKKFKDIADEFINFINNKKLIIHNAPFDVSFLNYELRKINKKIIENKNVVDSLEIARSKFPGVSNSLNNLCKRFGIDISKRTKHNALLDCELLREVYINLTGQKEPSMALYENEDIFDDIPDTKKLNREYSKMIIMPSEKEKEEHSNFLKEQIKKNYF